jgi:hypothetical protein
MDQALGLAALVCGKRLAVVLFVQEVLKPRLDPIGEAEVRKLGRNINERH